MNRIEYLTKVYRPKKHWSSKKYDNYEFDSLLTAMGRKGWELVQIVPVAAVYGATAVLLCTFKRGIIR